MSYEPKTDEELAKEGLLADGTYDGQIIEAADTFDSKGRDMISLKIKVWDNSGREKDVFDYISPQWFHFKFKHAFESAGKLDRYNTGEGCAEDLSGEMVRVEILTEEQDKFPPRNVVKDYDRSGAAEKSVSQKVKEEDDELPF